MLNIRLLSPAKLMTQGEFASVLFPGSKGYLEIGENHAALLTELASGCVVLRTSEKEKKKFFISGGYAHIKDNKIIILGEIVEAQSEINFQRAKKAEKRAAERLQRTSDGSIDIKRALFAQERARHRMEVAKERLS